jgi:hypothetical protein
VASRLSQLRQKQNLGSLQIPDLPDIAIGVLMLAVAASLVHGAASA